MLPTLCAYTQCGSVHTKCEMFGLSLSTYICLLILYKYHHSAKLHHEFVAVCSVAICIVMSAQHTQQCQQQQMTDIFTGIVWYYDLSYKPLIQILA